MNVTVSFQPEVHQLMQQRAADTGTSVSSMLSDLFLETVPEDQRPTPPVLGRPTILEQHWSQLRASNRSNVINEMCGHIGITKTDDSLQYAVDLYLQLTPPRRRDIAALVKHYAGVQ